MDAEQPRNAGPRKRDDFPHKSDSRNPDAPQQTIAEELIALDLDVMKLLSRRAKLVGKLRGGKTHATTPRAVSAEKEVRSAWEKNASRFSRDTKFSRQLFNLLQELEIDSRESLEAKGYFNLAPTRKPVDVKLSGPVDVTEIRLWATLAAAFGAPFQIDEVLLSDPLIECVKVLNQAGAHLSWTAQGSLENAAGDGLAFADKVFFVGEDALTFYLTALLALKETGKIRFTGGSALKMADFSAFRRFLPTLGARLAHTVPKSNGLPASVESSGMLPDSFSVPADLPQDAVIALFCAACTWGKPVQLDLALLPAFVSAFALAEMMPLLRASSIPHEIRGTVLRLHPKDTQLPGSPRIAMDPAIAAYFLALPAFAGGDVSLTGYWAQENPEALHALSLLRAAGLEVTITDTAIISRYPVQHSEFLFSGANLSDSLLPLCLALSVLPLWRGADTTQVPALPDTVSSEFLHDFYAQIGLVLENGALRRDKAVEQDLPPWTSPTPWWSLGFALCAYMRPKLQLTNPGTMTGLMPGFWNLYNSLPNPSVPKVKEVEDIAPAPAARRRVIAKDSME